MSGRYSSEILLKRFQKFALDCQKLTNKLPKTPSNLICCSQLIRSSSSPGSNYIEAIEASTKKEFIYRSKVCRKESKESNYWLGLIKNSNPRRKEIARECEKLINESKELIKILSSSIITAEKRK